MTDYRIHIYAWMGPFCSTCTSETNIVFIVQERDAEGDTIRYWDYCPSCFDNFLGGL